MKKTYKEKDLKDLYRVNNKFWKTGDTDFLTLCTQISQLIDGKFWSEIWSIVTIAIRKHLSIKTVMDILAILGYEVEEDK